MKLQKLAVAVMVASPALVHAAALDRSGLPLDALFEEGNYAEVGIAHVSPKVEGKLPAGLGGGDISDIAKSYNKPTASVKMSPSKNTAFLLKYGQPWGVNVEYDNSITGLGGTKAYVDSDSLTAVAAYKMESNTSIYGGLVFQQAEASVTEGGSSLTTLNMDKDSAVGYLVGAAYEVPEIALRADITYNSPISHEFDTTLNGVKPSSINPALSDTTKVKFPKSVNLNFQTGIMADTLLMTKLRWVNWKSVDVKKPDNSTLVSWNKNQLSGSVGIGRRFNEKLSGSVSYEFDSGTGKDASLLGPYSNERGITVAGQYKINDMYDIAAGVNYTKLGDAEAATPAGNAKFSGNRAIGAGVKLGIHY